MSPISTSTISCLRYAYLMSGAFLYAAHTMGKAKVSYPFLIALGVLFFSDIIAIVFFPGIYDTGELMYLPDAVTKVRYILGFSITCVGLYCVLGIAPQILRNKSTLDVFFLLLVLLASTAVIYSVIKEFDLYKAMIANGGPDDAYAVPIVLQVTATSMLACFSMASWRNATFSARTPIGGVI
jgi:hypothetical protein